MSSAPHVLPLPAERLLGRDQELAGLEAALLDPDVRLVTLTGPGGVGKSRLALAAAAAHCSSYSDGVVHVDLAAVTDPRLVPAVLAAATGGSNAATQSAAEALRLQLHDKQMLVVLDNCEHLVSVPAVVSDLVAACPYVDILATSRRPLNVRWEHRFPVAPLGLPASSTPTVAEALQSPAVELFDRRARLRDPTFTLNTGNLDDVLRLCRQLDGLPLAIEIAAARIDVLGLQEILDRIEKHLPLTQVGLVDTPDRHRSLDAAMEWSWALLAPEDQQLLARLAVLSGSWRLRDLPAVMPTEDSRDPVDAVSTLLDSSLLCAGNRRGGAPVFRMLEMVRQFALRKLQSAGDEPVARAQHADYIARVLEEASIELARGSKQALERMSELSNEAYSALDWLQRSSDARRLLQIASACGQFWWLTGNVSVGRRWLGVAVETDDGSDPLLSMTTLYAAGELALWQGDIRAGRGLHERQLALAEEAGDVVQAARARTSLGAAAALSGDYARGRQLVSQALAALGPAGDPRLRALALRNLGWVLRLDGDLRGADTALEQASVLFHELGDTNNEAVVAISQAEVARDRDDPRPVNGLLLRALALAVRGGDRRSLAYAAEVTATLPAVRPRPLQLVRLLGAVAAQYQSVGMPLDPRRRAALERLRGAARTQVSEEVFAQAWRDGTRLTPTELADTIQHLLSGGELPQIEAATETSTVPGASLLTEREKAVLQRVAAGKPTKHIARSLGIAERTVKSHLSSAFAKLGASSRGHAALLAVQQGLLDPPSESAATYSRSASA